ncbi:MAG: putative phage-associated protein [Bacteroidetes bacterium]|nr:putative phage-associated protein [Bacteroidota bacterium]
MAYSVLDVANKILAYGAERDGGELISNLKLQKLLYYMQGFYLAYFHESLFDEEIEAWQYGPVVPVVYEHYKDNGSAGISPSGQSLIFNLPKEETLFNEVFRVYGDYSAIGLMNLTHSEMPWKSTKIGDVIEKQKLNSFFGKRLK